MRLNDDLIEEVRTRNDIVNVIGEYVTLKRNGGSRYVGLCPFHNEHTPSFSVNRQNQLYYCFGCHVGGNVFTFMKEHESMTFMEALKYLADKVGVDLPDEPMSAEEKKRIDESDRMKEMYKDAAIFYYKALYTPAGKIGLDYFHKRGLDDAAIKKYGLGYSPSGSYLYNYLKKKGFSDMELKKSGLVRIKENGCFDYFWNRVMFPIFDKGNHVIAFGGRVMDDETKPKYLNSEESLIFKKSHNLYGQNIAARSRGDILLLCEGYMDVIALHQAGFTNAVAALGTAFNVDHVVTIRRNFKGKDKIILTLDSDGAGTKAARKAIGTLREGGIEDVRVLSMSPAKDPDEFIKTYGKEAYQERIDQAKNSFLFEVSCRRNDYDLNNADEKTKFHKSLVELLVPIEDEMLRTNYMEAVCRQEGIDFSVMKKQVNAMGENYRRKTTYVEPEKPYVKKKNPIDGIQKTEQLLITWMCSDIGVCKTVKSVLSADDFADELSQSLAGYIFEQAEGGRIDPAKIMDKFMDNEDWQNRIAAYFNYQGLESIDEESQNRALTEAVVKLKSNSLQRKSANCTDVAQLMAFVNEQKELKKLSLKISSNG